jgi:uncharacterized protein (DUF58 family)
MKLTRRGKGLVGLVVVSFLMATTYGARSLNAVMIPAIVALVGAAVQIRRADRPSFERRAPSNGFVGDTRTVTLDADAGTPISAVVTDETDDGLWAPESSLETTLGTASVSYDVTLKRRGPQRLGPATVTVTDVLGLVERSFEFRETDTVLAYPQVFDLAGGEGFLLGTDDAGTNREEFDTLREYARGDSLRDVHWKSSAKRPDVDLLVQEYRGNDRPEAVHVVAEAADTFHDHASAMATAAASVALALLDAGVPVALDAPDGSVDAGIGPNHRETVLTLLARTGAGRVPPERRDPGDVVVSAPDTGEVTVRAGDRTVPFDDLVEAPENATSSTDRSPSRQEVSP